jgi:hypothetical protein
VVEQRPFKPKVVGSIPTAPTNKITNVYWVVLRIPKPRADLQVRKKAPTCPVTRRGSQPATPCGVRSVDLFNVGQLPALAEDTPPIRAVEAEPRIPLLPRRGVDPVRLLAGGRLWADVDVHGAIGILLHRLVKESTVTRVASRKKASVSRS